METETGTGDPGRAPDVKPASFVKCSGCGAWIAVGPAPGTPAPPPQPQEAAGTPPPFELRDTRGGGRLLLTWRNGDGVTPDGRPLTSAFDVTLEFPGQIRAAAGLRTDIRGPLLHFFESLAALEGDWSEERRLADADRQFSITCLDCCRGEVRFDVSLGADAQDAAWTVDLSLSVPQDELKQTVEELRRFFALAGK